MAADRAPKARYTTEQWLREQYVNQSRSTIDIACEVGVSSSTIIYWMETFDIERRSGIGSTSGGDMEPLRNKEWLEQRYVTREESTYDIANTLGVSRKSVTRWLNKHGIETRAKVTGVQKGSTAPLRDREWVETQCVEKSKTPTEIADSLDIGYSDVKKWIDNHEITPQHYSERTEPLRDESWLREQYHQNGQSLTDIAEQLGVTHDTVVCWIEEHEIERRQRNSAASFSLA